MNGHFASAGRSIVRFLTLAALVLVGAACGEKPEAGTGDGQRELVDYFSPAARCMPDV